MNAHRSAIPLTRSTLTAKVGRLECETALAGSKRFWKRWGERRAVDHHTHLSFTESTFVRSVEAVPFEKRLYRSIYKLWADSFTFTVTNLDFWSGGVHDDKG